VSADVALWVAAVALMAVGLAGLVLPVIPGTPLLFAGFWLAAWIDGYAKVGGVTLAVLGVLALLAWAVDYVAAAAGVKRVGASGKAVAGALIGAVLGLAGGLVGLVVGPIVGAAVGEWIARRDPQQALRAGLAAGLGFVIAAAAKLGLAVAMLAVFAAAYLF
jgi:uncharacterized protein YqgC (DUF456 family)